MTDEPSRPSSSSEPRPAPPPVVPAAKPILVEDKRSIRSAASQGVQIVQWIVVAVLAFIAAIFVLRNWEDVSLDFVFGDVTLPLSLVMLLFLTIGMVLGPLLYWLLWSRKR